MFFSYALLKIVLPHDHDIFAITMMIVVMMTVLLLPLLLLKLPLLLTVRGKRATAPMCSEKEPEGPKWNPYCIISYHIMLYIIILCYINLYDVILYYIMPSIG